MDRLGAKTVWVNSACVPSVVTNESFPREWNVEVSPYPTFLIDYAEHTFVAHNARFDAIACAKLLDFHPQWCDSLPIARANGLPGGLDQIGKMLFGEGKLEGKNAVKLLSKVVIKNGKYQYPVGTLPLWLSLIEYNIDDVNKMRKFYLDLHIQEPDVIATDYAINARGFKVDTKFAMRLLDLYADHSHTTTEELRELIGDEAKTFNFQSPVQVKKWLANHGVEFKSLDKLHLREFFDNPYSYFPEDVEDEQIEKAFELLTLRKEIANTGSKKLAKMLEINSDGWIYDQIVYHGAHTGRFSGRALQPHNFPGAVAEANTEELVGLITSIPDTEWTERKRNEILDAFGVEANRIMSESTRKDCRISELLNTLIRPTIIPDEGFMLNVCDYNAVEARGVFWLFDDPVGLSDFATDGRDIYLEMASIIYGYPCTSKKTHPVERDIGKRIVLGGGYGMSHVKFNMTCKRYGVYLDKIGVDAKKCTESYRSRYKSVSNGWRKLGNLVKQVVITKRPVAAFRCYFEMSGEHLIITLPSNRQLTYRNAVVRDAVPKWCSLFGVKPILVPTIFYRTPHNYESVLYGGLMTENLVQAICRDLLAGSLVKCERERLNPVLHVHDEIVTMGPSDQLPTLGQIMLDKPEWARGFPIAVEGFSNPRYAKSPFRGVSKFEGKV